MIRLAASALLFATAAACAPVPAPEAANQVPVHGATGRVCNASAAQALVGRPATAELGAEAIRLSGAGTLRWMRPGDIVTMEFREGRLNIELDAANRVRSLRCG